MSKTDMMNRPLEEPNICNLLTQNGIKTIEFIKNIYHEYTTVYQDYYINVYEYIPGKVYNYNTLDDEYVDMGAEILAKINICLSNVNLLNGIDNNFFKYMTMQRAKASYLKTKSCTDNELIISNIDERIELIDIIKDYTFNYDKFTVLNSHGDYTNNQIVVNNNEMYVIDFTCACKQIIVWELTRFFFHADKSAVDGFFDEERFNKYLSNYTKYIKLNEYDHKNILKVYFYQILVCDYYKQYLDEKDSNTKEDYYTQALFASKIIHVNKSLIIDLFKKGE